MNAATPTITYSNVTSTQIRALRQRAASASNHELVGHCNNALIQGPRANPGTIGASLDKIVLALRAELGAD